MRVDLFLTYNWDIFDLFLLVKGSKIAQKRVSVHGTANLQGKTTMCASLTYNWDIFDLFLLVKGSKIAQK